MVLSERGGGCRKFIYYLYALITLLQCVVVVFVNDAGGDNYGKVALG